MKTDFVQKAEMFVSANILRPRKQKQISNVVIHSFFLYILSDALTDIIDRCALYTPGNRKKASKNYSRVL